MPENQAPPQEYHVYDPEKNEVRIMVIHPPRRRYWLHALLFLAAIFTTLCVGARLQYGFDHNLGLFVSDSDWWPWQWIWQDWHRLKLGIPFSACLLGILTAHEFGHYVLCVRRKVFATLPFFIPAPTLIGSMGAFIRITSPIRSRIDLFDIGIAGPIAGFVVAVPVLTCGLLMSKPLVDAAANSVTKGDALTLGLPLIFNLAHWAISAVNSHALSPVSVNGLYLHPVAVAAWAGMFATALNLLPGGQLDGGHIVFAVNPRWHRPISVLSIAVLLPLGWFYWAGWILWAIVLRFTGSRHPDVPHVPALDTKRKVLAVLALIMLFLTFAPSPVGGDSGLGKVIDSYRHSEQQSQSK